jgi:predicted RNA methylase
MNAQTNIGGEHLPATMADITDLCAGRDKAIQLWCDQREAFHATAKAARFASLPAFSPLQGPGDRIKERDQRLHEAFCAADTVRVWNEGRYSREDVSAAEQFRALVTAEIDRRCWDDLATRTGAMDLMDRQAKDEWRASLESPAPFTVENCLATFAHLVGNRREMYLRGIANVFSALDRRFRSHDGFKIGGRLIIERALEPGWSSYWWKDHNRQDTLHDVERIFYELENEEQPALTSAENTELDKAQRDGRPIPFARELPIVRAVSFEASRSRDQLPCVIKGRFFRVRIFKNGNLHVWFERADLLEQVNKLLAEYYGEAIGDSYNSTEADDAPEYHQTPAKRFGAFNTSDDLAKLVCAWADIGKGQSVLEPSAGTGQLAKVARANGAAVTCVEVQEGLAHELGRVHGFRAFCGDFLKASPAELGQYDVVLMNPPFDRGRDCDHVRHAWQFVKPGGRLVAIMSARAEYGEDKRHKALHRIIEAAEPHRGQSFWWDLPDRSFAHAGTNVNTVCLMMRKPRA